MEMNWSFMMIACLSIASVAKLLITFSPVARFSESKAIVIGGLVLSGIEVLIPNYAVSQVLTYSKPQINEEEYGRLVSTVASLRSLSLGLGLFLGPFIG